MNNTFEMRSFSSAIFSFFVFTLLSFSMNAEDQNFELSGLTADNEAPLAGVKVTVYEGSIFMTQSSTSSTGKFVFSLEFNKNFKISLEKEGYATEDISINTTLPAGSTQQKVTHQISLKMFSLTKETFPFTFDEPVAKIFFHPVIKGFTSDVNYKKTFNTKIEKTPTIHDKLGNGNVSEEFKYELTLRRNQPKKKEEEVKPQEAKTETKKEVAVAVKTEEKTISTETKTVAVKTERKAAEIQSNTETKTLAAATKSNVQEEKKTITAETAVIKKEKEIAEAQVNSKKITATEEKVSEAKVLATVKTPSENIKKDVVALKQREEAVTQKSTVAMSTNNLEQKRTSTPVIEKKEEKKIGQETYVERTRKINSVVVELNGRIIEFTEVIYNNGGTYYFKNGASISAESFKRETAKKSH